MFFFSVQKSLLSWAVQAHRCSALDTACGSRRHHHTHPLYVVVLRTERRAELSGRLLRCVRGGGTVRSLCAPAGMHRQERAIERLWVAHRLPPISRRCFRQASCANTWKVRVDENGDSTRRRNPSLMRVLVTKKDNQSVPREYR